MDVPRRGGPNYSFAGFMLLAALGAFLWKSIPLESSRPSASGGQWHPSELSNQVPARLWQDPLEAVFDTLARAPAENSILGSSPAPLATASIRKFPPVGSMF